MTVSRSSSPQDEEDRAIRFGVPAAVGAATVFGTVIEVTYAAYPIPFAPGAYLFALLTSAALIWRATRPITVAVVILVLVLGYHLAGYPGQAPALPLFIAVFAAAARIRMPWGLLAGFVVGPLWSVIPTLPGHPTPWLSAPVLGPLLSFCGAVVAGGVAAALTARTAARNAAEAADERMRIARDMHDVLAHTLAAITVQTSVALDVFESDPAVARTAVMKARSLARDAVPQLKDSLRSFRAGAAPISPQPTLHLIGDVLSAARDAGVAVDADLRVTSADVSPLLELTIARIVQEAVTNALRHSRATTLRVSAALEHGAVVIEVVNDGVDRPGPEGLGMTGMRERARSVGGTLHARSEHGTFTVTAALPAPDRIRALP